MRGGAGVEAPEARATSQRGGRSCAEVFELGGGSVDCHCKVVKWEQDREERRETGGDGGGEGDASILRGASVSGRRGRGARGRHPQDLSNLVSSTA